MSATFKDEDHGYKALVRRVFEFAKPVVTVGIHEKAGSASLTNGKTLIDIANINEFGSADGHVPSRSFVRGPFDAAEPGIRRDLESDMRDVVAGKLTKEQTLERVGRWAVGAMQDAISNQIPPPNAPSTIAKKGSSTPLVDTRFLRNSLTYEVDPTGEGK